MVRDETIGHAREVDVHIATKRGGESTTIGIECVAQARPTDVTWVEARIQKHRDLGTNRVVLVSKSGFTPAAAQKATHHGAVALSLQAATMASWRNLPGPGHGFEIRGMRLSNVRIVMTKDPELRIQHSKGPALPPIDIASALICDRTCTMETTLQAMLEEVLNSSETIAQVEAKTPDQDGERPISFRLEFPEGVTLRQGICTRLLFSLDFKGTCRIVRIDAPLSPSLYRNIPVVTGASTLDGQQLVVAAAQEASNKFSVAVSLGPGEPPLVIELESISGPTPNSSPDSPR